MAKVRAFTWQRFEGIQLAGCRRAAFLLDVPDYLYDLYFNSPVGYRAQYARSPNIGDHANRTLLTDLGNLLVAQASDSAEVGRILASMGGTQAKTWIDEPEVESHFANCEPEIDYPPWSNPDWSNALRAPIGSRLVVLGGWLDQSGVEVLNPFKIYRSQEIHDQGFS